MLNFFKTKHLWLIFRLLALLIIIFGLWFDWTLWRIVVSSTTYQLPDHADAIVVLGCGPLRSGAPSSCQIDRAAAGVELWQAGYADVIVLTGGETGKGTEASMLASLVVKAGVPLDKIILEEKSHSTFENLYFAKELLAQRNWQTIILVSEPYHLYRARQLASSQEIQVSGWWPAVRSYVWHNGVNRSFNLVKDAAILMLYEARTGFGLIKPNPADFIE